jgi:hypothetical protein
MKRSLLLGVAAGLLLVSGVLAQSFGDLPATPGGAPAGVSPAPGAAVDVPAIPNGSNAALTVSESLVNLLLQRYLTSKPDVLKTKDFSATNLAIRLLDGTIEFSGSLKVTALEDLLASPPALGFVVSLVPSIGPPAAKCGENEFVVEIKDITVTVGGRELGTGTDTTLAFPLKAAAVEKMVTDLVTKMANGYSSGDTSMSAVGSVVHVAFKQLKLPLGTAMTLSGVAVEKGQFSIFMKIKDAEKCGL